MYKFVLVTLIVLFIITISVALTSVGVWLFQLTGNIYVSGIPVAGGILMMYGIDYIIGQEE